MAKAIHLEIVSATPSKKITSKFLGEESELLAVFAVKRKNKIVS